MLTYNLFKTVEWYFKHYNDLLAAGDKPSAIIGGRTVEQPQAWADVVQRTYDLHRGVVANAMRERYQRHKTSAVISGLKGINRQMFYVWRSEFLLDAVIMAIERKILKSGL